MSVTELESAFERLSAREKEEFAEWYEARLARVGPDPTADKIWATEAERRRADITSGKMAALPGDQVMAEFRRRYGG